MPKRLSKRVPTQITESFLLRRATGPRCSARTARPTVDRTKFGLNWNNPLPSGDPALANDVTIIVDLQLSKES